MLVLFFCLAVAVVIQALSAAVLCAQGATVDEITGRTRLEEKDQGLAALRQRALLSWETMPWTVVRGGEAAVQGTLTEFEGGEGWVLSAATRQEPSASVLRTSAWVERGRDGIDLPLAALAAGSVTASEDRSLPWMELDAPATGPATPAPPPAAAAMSAAAGAAAHVVAPLEESLLAEGLLGEGCSVVRLPEAWRLDPGWLLLQSREELEAQITGLATDAPFPGAGPSSGDSSSAGDPSSTGEANAATGEGPAESRSLPAVAPSTRTAVLTAPHGRTMHIPGELGRGAVNAPILVVVKGGADLDARALGDLYGVLVVDEGSVFLDGTTLHGAVFATDAVSLGETGCLLFSRPVLRWATDRSLTRARLVPGTRWEGME